MKKNIVFAFATFVILGTATPTFSIEKIQPDARAVKLVDRLLRALSQADPERRVKAVLPLVHASLRTRDGSDLDQDTKRYSYKKAWQNVKFYAIPARIYEVHKGRPVTIGYGPTAERGRKDKYFVNKKPGVAGRPAPITVFWPANGGAPTILDMGSL